MNTTLTTPKRMAELAESQLWSDMIELDFIAAIPEWERKLKGAIGRTGPSAERYRATLLKDLAEAYNYIGLPGREQQRLAELTEEWKAEQAAKGKPAKAAPKPAAKPAAKPTAPTTKAKAPKNTFAALANDSDSD